MSLLKKIKKAVPERDAQLLAFQEYTSALPKEAVERWRVAVENWERDPTKPNPFYLNRPGMRTSSYVCCLYLYICAVITEAAMKLQISEADARALQNGTGGALHEKLSAGGVVMVGIEIEDHQ